MYEPVAFLSITFKHSPMNWSTPEKECFVIVEPMNKLDDITLGRAVNGSTNHHDQVRTYGPGLSNMTLPRNAMNKMNHW